jgi:hypothetical protein
MTHKRTAITLTRTAPGLYLIDGTDWAIGRTDGLYEGPRGGSRIAWELRRKGEMGWYIDATPGFRTLREARDWIAEHPETVGLDSPAGRRAR